MGDWWQHGACRGMDPDLFFPVVGTNADQAKATCAICPVRHPCLMFALEQEERHGIWGGTSEKQRRRLRIELAETGQITVPPIRGKHGTEARYRWHRRHGVPVCEPCKQAHLEYTTQTYAGRVTV